jgi:hypothetical protein
MPGQYTAKIVRYHFVKSNSLGTLIVTIYPTNEKRGGAQAVNQHCEVENKYR